MSLRERFEAKFLGEPNSGCWLWDGAYFSDNYGVIRNEFGIHEGAHRVSWRLNNGPIPEGMDVLHKCDTPPCVNPAHLFVGTHTDNMRDATRKGRIPSAQAAKTHCPQGHAYSGSNVRVETDRSGKKGRKCKTCCMLRERARRKAIKEKGK